MKGWKVTLRRWSDNPQVWQNDRPWKKDHYCIKTQDQNGCFWFALVNAKSKKVAKEIGLKLISEAKNRYDKR